MQQSVPWTSTLLHDCGITESNAGKLAQIISKTNIERQTWATIEKRTSVIIGNPFNSFGYALKIEQGYFIEVGV